MALTSVPLFSSPIPAPIPLPAVSPHVVEVPAPVSPVSKTELIEMEAMDTELESTAPKQEYVAGSQSPHEAGKGQVPVASIFFISVSSSPYVAASNYVQGA